MGTIIPEGFANCVFSVKLSLNNKSMSFGLGIGPGIVGSPTADDIAESVNEIVKANGFPFQASNFLQFYTYTGVVVTQTVGGLPVIAQRIEARAGTASSEAMPPNGAVLIKKNTALGGRINRGRMYLPPFSLGEDSVDSAGILSDAVRGTIQGEWDNVWDEIIASDLVPVLLHSGADDPTPISSFSVESTIATQRRRLRG